MIGHRPMVRARRLARARRRLRDRPVIPARPSARLRLAALAAAAAVTWLSLDGPIGPAVAATQRPAPITAWWTTANLGHGVAVPGSVLGASGKQLLVEGSNAVPAVSAVSTAPVSSIAVAAIRWQLPAGRTASAVALPMAGSAPPFVTVQACRATATFKPVYGGPYADVPHYTCAGAIDAVVKSGRLVFPGVAKLVTGNTLSLLLLPGPLDRVALAPPTAASLALVSTARPSRGRPTAGGLPSGGGHHAPSAAAGTAAGAGATGPASLPAVPPAPQTEPPASAPPPVVAGAGGAQAAPVALTSPAPRWRRWVAFAVVMLEVAVFAVTRRRPAAASATSGRGIGRFVAPRETPAARL
jgi:hypothetical protein